MTLVGIGRPGEAVANETAPTRRRHGRDLAPWLFLAPALLFGVVFFLVPILFAGAISLTRWNALAAPRFVGWDNYGYLLSVDPRFWPTVANTMVFAAGSIAIGIPLAMLGGSTGVRLATALVSALGPPAA